MKDLRQAGNHRKRQVAGHGGERPALFNSSSSASVERLQEVQQLNEASGSSFNLSTH
jgi:hypothetical protein